jgi:DNA helicase-2/ATP-dependent DNA helicase PcrA
VNTKKVSAQYFPLLEKLGSEFKILLEISPENIERASTPLIRKAIERMRSGAVHITPGYDGVYGKVTILDESERRTTKGR